VRRHSRGHHLIWQVRCTGPSGTRGLPPGHLVTLRFLAPGGPMSRPLPGLPPPKPPPDAPVPVRAGSLPVELHLRSGNVVT